MRVLILSCSTGEGHNACARAIQECFHSKSISCDREDAFRFISRGVSQVVSGGFARIYRHTPKLFEIGYNYTERHPGILDEDSGLYKIITMGADRLFRFIYSGSYDTIICTHIFAAMMITDIKRRYPIQLHTSFFPTDYTCYPGCEFCDLDAFFIPSPDLIPDFVQKGIPAEKLVPTGIPIRTDFYSKMDRIAARRKLNIPEDCRHLMVMCGSMGCGPIRKITKLIQDELPANCLVTVLCGTNQQLYHTMSKAFAGDERFHICQFVRDVSTLMDSADLYLTKPGGLSVTEASHKRLPMVFVHAVDGCEAYNKQFFTQRGMAFATDDLSELAHLTVSLLCNEAKLAEVSAAQAKHFPSNSTEEVTAYLIAAAEQRTKEVPTV